MRLTLCLLLSVAAFGAHAAAVDLTHLTPALRITPVDATLDPAPLLAHRERFPAWMDADRFALDL